MYVPTIIEESPQKQIQVEDVDAKDFLSYTQMKYETTEFVK